MKPSLCLFMLLFMFSCTEKIVQLPETTNKSVTEVKDVSPVYMFYNEDTGAVDFNRKNMISTTNWLVNIDKRLTLEQILPHLQYLQGKRQGDGMHKNENARNYFTCNNTALKNLSFIEFTDLEYKTTFTNKNTPNFSLITYFGLVKFSSSETFQMEIISEKHSVNESYNKIDELINEIHALSNDGRFQLSLSFNSDLSFQDYIKIKTKLLNIKSDSLQVLNQEVIHN